MNESLGLPSFAIEPRGVATQDTINRSHNAVLENLLSFGTNLANNIFNYKLQSRALNAQISQGNSPLILRDPNAGTQVYSPSTQTILLVGGIVVAIVLAVVLVRN